MKTYSTREREIIFSNLGRKPLKMISALTGRSYKGLSEFIKRCGMQIAPNYSDEEIRMILQGNKTIPGRSISAVRTKRCRLRKMFT